MGRRSDIDWEAAERSFRIGLLTLKQITEKYKISDSQLRAKAKAGNWERDLSADVRVAAKAKVIQRTRAQAEQELRASIEQSAEQSAVKSAVVTLDAVDTAAEVIATIEMRQRGRLGRLGVTFANLMSRFEQASEEGIELRELADKIEAGDPTAAGELRKLTTIPLMIDTAKRAVELNSKLQADERIAFGMNAKDGDGDSVPERVADAVKKLNGAS